MAEFAPDPLRSRSGINTVLAAIFAVFSPSIPGQRVGSAISIGCSPRRPMAPILRSAIVATATGLRLKALPPVRASRAAANGVKIQAVQSRPEWGNAWPSERRSTVSWAISSSDVMADPSGVELDSYDGRSIHFSAIRGSEVVGTVRVVLELAPNLEATRRPAESRTVRS